MSGTLPTYQQVTGYRYAETFRGDTLQGIAARVLGDAARWTDLAALNALVPPYIVDDLADATPQVLLAGQLIKIPAPGPAPTGTAEVQDPYGTDLLLADGQLIVTAAGDFQTVSGVPNLDQALRNRLATHTGELIFHWTYGNRAFRLIGRGVSPVMQQLAATWTANTLAADPRITGTQAMRAVAAGDRIVVAGEAVAVDGRVLPVGGT